LTAQQQALEDKLEDANEAREEGRFERALGYCDDIIRADPASKPPGKPAPMP
jgi:hypothetical protein